MEPKTKKTLLIGGSLVVIAGVVGYFLYRRSKTKKFEQKKSDTPPVAQTTGDSVSSSSQTTATKPKEEKPKETPKDPKAWSNKDKVFLNAEQQELYSYPDAKYGIGKVEKSVFLDKPIGYYIEPGPKGWEKIVVTGYRPYSKESASYGTYKWAVTTVYVKSMGIRKTPY